MARDYQIFDTDVQGVSVTIYPTGYRARTLCYRAVGRHRPMPGEPSTGTCHGQLQAVMPVDLQLWRARGKQPLQANVRKGPTLPAASQARRGDRGRERACGQSLIIAIRSATISSTLLVEVLKASLSAIVGLKLATSSFETLCQIGSIRDLPDDSN